MWFTETPWPPMVLCSVAAVCFFAAWHVQRRNLQLLGVGLMLILSVVIYVSELLIVTQREEVEARIHGLGAAVADLDTESALTYVSMNASAIRENVRSGMSILTSVESMHIKDVRVTMKAMNSRASTHFRANGVFGIGDVNALHQFPSRWEVTWQREGNEWKIIRVQQLNPVSGKPIRTIMSHGAG